MKKRKLNYRFHDPNPPGATADLILNVFMEVNAKKVERALRAAAEALSESNDKPDSPEEDSEGHSE